MKISPATWIKRYVHGLLATRSPRLALLLVKKGVFAGHFRRNGQLLQIIGIDVAMPQTPSPNQIAFLEEIDAALLLHNAFGASFECDGEDVLITVQGTRFTYFPGSLGTLVEVWHGRIYNFAMPTPCVAIDIGMNVGYASLFLAQMANVTRVYSYEPFEASFRQAERNFAMNPDIGCKIKAHHAAIAKTAGTIEAQYAPELNVCARIGNYKEEDYRKATFTTQIVTTLAAADVLRDVTGAHPGIPIVAKIDCEGAEYDILEAWDEAGLLRCIDVYMIEWHDQGSQPLADRLAASGYAVFTSHPYDRSFALLYAARRP